MTLVLNDVVVVDCIEYEHIELDPELWLGAEHQTIFNSEISGRDVLRASFRNGVLRLQATSYVGVIPLNERVLVRVRPRVPIANLTRMVLDTGHDVLALSAFRDYSSRGTAGDWTMDLYTDALLDYLDGLLDQGLLRAYGRRQGEGHFPHGRIDIAPTVQRFTRRAIPNKAVFSWYERTVDTPVNRCLRAALEVVLSHLTKPRTNARRGDRQRLRRVEGQLHALREVSENGDERFLDDPHVLGLAPLPDSRSYYRPVLDLAVLIVRGAGLALEIGGYDVQISSLLIDTNKLFEKFVRVSIRRHAARYKWPVEVLDGNNDGWVDLYDVPDQPPSPLGSPMAAMASIDAGRAQPDVVFRAFDGTIPLIAEVKNTLHGKHAKTADVLPDRDEVEQAVTYGLRYGLGYTVLIHPWFKGTKGLVYVGRVRSIDVYDYRLDLSSDEDLDGALEEMCGALGKLADLKHHASPTSG